MYDFARSAVRVARSCLILQAYSFVVGAIERSKQWTEVKVARVLAHAEGADVPVESEHQDTQDQHLLKHNPNTHRNATASYNENHPKTDQDAKS